MHEWSESGKDALNSGVSGMEYPVFGDWLFLVR